MNPELTKRQQEILEFIRNFSAEKLMPPTLTEISEHFHIRCSSVAYHLNALKKKGRLTRTNESRSITLEGQVDSCRRKDCLRQVSLPPEKREYRPGPGETVEDLINEEHNTIYISDQLLSICSAEHFIAFRQTDDSMFGLGIHNADIVLAVPVRFKKPLPGDIVLADTPDGRTILRSYFIYSKKQYELAPANSNFKSETYAFSSGVVTAVVVSLLRHFF